MDGGNGAASCGWPGPSARATPRAARLRQGAGRPATVPGPRPSSAERGSPSPAHPARTTGYPTRPAARLRQGAGHRVEIAAHHRHRPLRTVTRATRPTARRGPRGGHRVTARAPAPHDRGRRSAGRQLDLAARDARDEMHRPTQPGRDPIRGPAEPGWPPPRGGPAPDRWPRGRRPRRPRVDPSRPLRRYARCATRSRHPHPTAAERQEARSWHRQQARRVAYFNGRIVLDVTSGSRSRDRTFKYRDDLRHDANLRPPHLRLKDASTVYRSLRYLIDPGASGSRSSTDHRGGAPQEPPAPRAGRRLLGDPARDPRRRATFGQSGPTVIVECPLPRPPSIATASGSSCRP